MGIGYGALQRQESERAESVYALDIVLTLDSIQGWKLQSVTWFKFIAIVLQ